MTMTMTTSNRSLAGGLLLILLTPHLTAQQAPSYHVVPAAFTSKEAYHAVFWAISPFPARRQLLIDAGHLVPALNQTLKGIRVRRNGGDPDTFPAGSLHLVLSLSNTTRLSKDAAVAFAANRGQNPVQVFSGRVDLPQSPPPTVQPAAWTTPFSVQVPFSRAYPYGGGNLCIESLTSLSPNTGGTAGPWWPLDGLRQDKTGTVVADGLGNISCIPGLPGHPADADAASQNLGSSAVLFLRGNRTEGSGMALLGLDNKTLDLTPFGAPGCNLYLDPLVMAPIALTSQPGGLGHASLAVPVPYDKGLQDLSYYSQWVLYEQGHNSLDLTFSNHVKATIGPWQPPLGISWIESTDPSAPSGRILSGRTPVLRFDL